MRVLMIAPQPFLEPRGTPISVFQRLQGLSALGYKVDLVTYHVGEPVELSGVTLHRIPHIPGIKQVKVGPSWAKLVLDFFVFWKAFFLLLTRRYDVVHSHEEAAFMALFLAPLFHVRHLYDMHSSLPRQLANFNFGNYRPLVGLFEWLERQVLRSCDAVITIGPDLQSYVYEVNPAASQVMIQNLPVQVAKNGHPPANGDGHANGNGYRAEQLRHHLDLTNKLPIIYTGTLERYQGIDLLIDSADIIRQRYPDFSLVLVGGKPQQVEQWRHEVSSRQLTDHVKLVGTVPIEEVADYLDLAEILVSPRIEGTSVPLKIYSYLHSGKSILATDLPAHALVLDHETAVLVEPTKDAVADGLLRLIQTPTLRQRLGRQARHLAEEKYSLKNYLARLSHVYGSLVPSPAATVPQPNARPLKE